MSVLGGHDEGGGGWLQLAGGVSLSSQSLSSLHPQCIMSESELFQFGRFVGKVRKK